MATLEDIRRQFPQAAGMSDSEIITKMSEAGGLDPKYVAGRLGVDINPDGFKSGLKRGLAGMVGGVGEVVGDATGRRNNALTNFAKDVEFRNPSEINSLQDVLDKPGTAMASALGNAASFLIPGGGLKLGAAGLRAAKAANTARAIDNPLTQAAVAGLPSLGEIGDSQREQGVDNPWAKYGGALAVGAVENLGGVQRVLGFGGQQARRTAAQEVAGFGNTPWKTALKTTGRMMGQEGLEEVAQTPIEQVAGYRDPTTAQALEETALGGVMGTLGGVIGAGHGAAQGLRHAQIKRGISTDLLNPDADFGRRLNLGEYEREFRARDIGRDQADQWYGSFSEGLVQDRDANTASQEEQRRRQVFADNTAQIARMGQAQDLLAGANPDTRLRDFIDQGLWQSRVASNRMDRPAAVDYQRWWENVPDPTNPAAYEQFWQRVAPVVDQQANQYGVTPDMFGAPPSVPVSFAPQEQAASAPVNKRQMAFDFDAPVAPPVMYAAPQGVFSQRPIGDPAGTVHRMDPMYGVIPDMFGAPPSVPVSFAPREDVTPAPVNKRQAGFDFDAPAAPAVLYGNQRGAGAFSQVPIGDGINTMQRLDDEATVQNIPLPNDVGSAAAVLNMAGELQKAGKLGAVMPGTPLHRAIVQARMILSGAGLEAPTAPVSPTTTTRQPTTRQPTQSAPAPSTAAPKEKPAPSPKPPKSDKARQFEAELNAAVEAGVPGASDVQREWNQRNKTYADYKELAAKLRDVKQGPDVPVKTAEQVLAEKAASAVSATDKTRAALTDKQRKVFDYLMDAAKNDAIDTVVDAEGKFKYAEIGKALGLARGSAKSFIDQAAKRIAATQGVDMETLKAGLRERAKRQRSTEEAAASKLGDSPAEQESVFDEGALFGNDAGAEANAGVVDSVGGSQSDIGDGGVDPEKVAPATEARDVKRAEREAAELKARQGAADQEAAKIEARRKAAAESQRVEDAPALPAAQNDEELFAGQKDWQGNPIRVVDVEDAAMLWDEKADGLPLEGTRRVQFVKAYIAWTDGELSDRRFFETLSSIADEVETAGQAEDGGLHRDSREVQGEAPSQTGGRESDLRGVTEERDALDEPVADADPEVNAALQTAIRAKVKQHGAAKYGEISQQLRLNGVSITPETQLFAFKLLEDNGSTAFSPRDVEALKLVAGEQTDEVSPDDVDFDSAPDAPTTSARRIEPLAGRRTFVRAMVGLRNNLPKSPTLDAELRKNLVAGNVKGALDAIANGGSSVAARQLAKKVSALMTGDVRVEVVEPGKYYPEGVPNILASAYGVAEIDRDNKRITIYLRSDVGVSEETVLHEALHAALQSRYDFLEYGDAKGKAGEAALAQFKDTWAAFQAEVSRATGELPIGVREAARSPDEFITYALTNPETQAWMQSRRYRGQTLWERFKNFVASVLGFRSAPSWLDAAMRVSNELLEGAAQDKADFSASDALTGRSAVSPQLIELADRYGPTAAKAVTDTSNILRKAGDSMLFLHDLVDKYKGQLKSAGAWYKAVQGSIARKHQLEQDAEQIATRAAKPGVDMGRVNDFISRSTFEQKWGYDATFDGVNGPKSVKADPAMAAEFKRLSADEQQLIKDVFAHGEKMATTKFKLLKDLGLTDNGFLTMGKLVGPYAPLKRFGNYVSVGKSQQLADLEAKRAEQEKNGAKTTEVDKQIQALKADPTHYIVSYHATPGLAREEAKARATKYAFTDHFEKSTRVDQDRKMPQEVFQKIIAAVNAESLPGEVKEAMRTMVEQLYVEALDEHNARTSGLKRENRAGYDPDMMKAFLSHARAEANFLANIEFGPQMNEQFFAMQNAAKDEGGKRSAQDAFNEFGKHYAENLTYRETPWQDRAMALTSAWQLATSVGYHVTNATQGLMVTVPKLAADFGDYAGAWRHMMDGYRTLATTGVKNLDISKVGDAGLRDALQRASDMGVLDVGMDEDLTQFDVLRTGYAGVDKASSVARKALHALRQMSRWVETANRVSAATAAYRMAREKSRSVEEAQDYAVKILQSTQGDFSRVGAPLLLKKLPKPMTQYRKYQFMMGALYAKAFSDAFGGADADTKVAGRRMLKYKLAHTAFAAGALGLPLMNLATLVFAATGDGDEPRDLERWLRDTIGDETLADLLLHGVPAMAGVDMHAKLGDDKIFSITPYTEWDLSSRDGFAKTLVGFMGPAAAQGATFADGVGKMQNGDYYKGLEQFMPKGIKDGMAAFRTANEGYTLTNGDVMVGPEDISGFSLAANALGLPSTEIKKIQWLRGQQYEAKQFFTERTREIQREYARAVEAGDDQALSELRDEWMALQDGKDKIRPYFNNSPDELRRQALSTLLKYPGRVVERERKLQASVPE